MLRSVWLSPSPRGEGSFFSIVADVLLVTIPFPLIVIITILAAVMIRFMPAWGRSRMIPWVMHEYRKNLPNICSDWQKEPFCISPDVIMLLKMASSGTFSGIPAYCRYFTKIRQIIALKCTLMDAFGWQISWVISQNYWSLKRRAVLRVVLWVMWGCPVPGTWQGNNGTGQERAGKSIEKPGADWAPIGHSGGSFSTNSTKCSTIVLGYSRFEAGLAIGGNFAAENDR